ncbi:MAG: peptidyl-prolyl cis-trans isomerase SurA, partial [Gammaproteobacteria bacterium]
QYEYRLSHILLALPDAAAPEKIAKARETATQIISQLEQGTAFDQLANSFSASDTALQGGDLGWRKKAQIPALFTDQLITMEPGGFAGPIRSASGFHIISLQDRRNLQQVLTRQTKSRHILIKPNALISEDEARDRLIEFRKRIESGEDFARLAKLYSVDYVSGSDGGSLGWTDPGSMVSEFENMTAQLEEGEISVPFRTQFGWHIVQLTGRRTLDETADNRRNKIRQQLLQQKQQEVFDLWKRKLRDEAFVNYPDA